MHVDVVLPQAAYDFRLTVARETPVSDRSFDPTRPPVQTRQKDRLTYRMTNGAWVFDLTHVVTSSSSEPRKTSYELEVELAADAGRDPVALTQCMCALYVCLL